MNYIPQILNGLGLALDIYGAYGVFRTKIIGVKSESDFKYEVIPSNSTWHNLDQIKKQFEKLIEDINERIRAADEANKRNDKIASRYFRFIFLGFIFQFASIVVYVLSTLF